MTPMAAPYFSPTHLPPQATKITRNVDGTSLPGNQLVLSRQWPEQY